MQRERRRSLGAKTVAHPPRRSPNAWLITCLVSSLLLAACGSTNSSSASSTLSRTNAEKVLVGAYDHTIATGSFTLASTLHVTVAGRKLRPFSSSEVITTNPPAARLAVSQPTGGAQEQVVIGDTEYLQVAASIRKGTTKRWLAFPLMPQAGVTNSGTIGTVVTSHGATGSLSGGPLAPLNLVKDHASGQVQELGRSTIGTTLTTAYRTSFLQRTERTQPDLSRSGEVTLTTTNEIQHVTLTVWISDTPTSLIKQLVITQRATVDHRVETTISTERFSGFGNPVQITPPPINSVSTDPPGVSGGRQTTAPRDTPLAANPVITAAKTFKLGLAGTQIVPVNNGALIVAEPKGHSTTLIRLDPATRAITAMATMPNVNTMTYAYGELMVETSSPSHSGADATTLEALNPETLSTLYERALPDPLSGRGSSMSSMVSAGGRLWVATTTQLLGFSSSLRLLAHVAIPNGNQSVVELAAPPDGQTLYTTVTGDGGGPVEVQQRDLINGKVVASLPRRAAPIGIGGVQIVPTNTSIWLAAPTGLEGQLDRIEFASSSNHALTDSTISANTASFSNGLRLVIAGPTLWVYEINNALLQCRSSATGSLLATAKTLPVIFDISTLRDGELAVAFANDEIAIGWASSTCIG
jgi:hypothetical protein